MKVRAKNPTTGKSTAYTLAPTSHLKGGEAWDVSASDGVPLGILRRWERDEIHATIGPRGGTVSKRRVTYWTVYDSTGVDGKVHSSRTRALLALAERVKCPA